jgi:transposase
MKHYAGIDLSMETSYVCVVDTDGRKLGSACVDSTPEAIAAVLERYGPVDRAVIETGRMTPSIALGLRDLGIAIVCIDARQAHQSLKAMKANKTDPHDAAGLAQLARTGFYKEVHVKSPAAHGVRSVITARGHLVEARVRLDNTIRGLCATFGIRLGIGQGERFLARMRVTAYIPGLGEAVASLLRARESLVDEIRQLDRQLKAISVASAACQALMSIPGVGVQTPAAPPSTMRHGSSDPELRAPTSASSRADTSRASSTGPDASPSRATAPSVSSSTRRPTRS